jgi:uncharacterized protein YegP (UPF0339 family)
MTAKFELFKDTARQFRFHLKAANGEIIAASQGYASKAAAQNGLASVKANAATHLTRRTREGRDELPVLEDHRVARSSTCEHRQRPGSQPRDPTELGAGGAQTHLESRLLGSAGAVDDQFAFAARIRVGQLRSSDWGARPAADPWWCAVPEGP